MSFDEDSDDHTHTQNVPDDDIEETSQNKQVEAIDSLDRVINDAAQRMSAATPLPVGRGTYTQAQPPPSPPTTPPSQSHFSSLFSQFSSPSPPVDNAQRPPASSTPQSRTSTNQASNPAPTPPQREPSAPMLELEGTLVPDIPIYDGVQVSDEG